MDCRSRRSLMNRRRSNEKCDPTTIFSSLVRACKELRGVQKGQDASEEVVVGSGWSKMKHEARRARSETAAMVLSVLPAEQTPSLLLQGTHSPI